LEHRYWWLQHMQMPGAHERESLEDRLPCLLPEAMHFLKVTPSPPVAHEENLRDTEETTGDGCRPLWHSQGFCCKPGALLCFSAPR